MLKRFKNFFSVFSGLIASFLISVPVMAGDTLGVEAFNNASNLSSRSLHSIVGGIINVLLGLLGIVVVGIMIYAGFLWLTSAGNDEKISKAKKLLVNGLIGLVLILSSYAIARFILSRLSAATDLVGNEAYGRCADPDYATTYPDRCAIPGSFSCADNPTLCCTRDNFVVQSITPRTNAAPLNNAVVRVVFSRPPRGNPSDFLVITRGGTDVSDQFDFSFSNLSNRLVEARPRELLAQGAYVVAVTGTLRDVSGIELAETVSCGNFPSSGSFAVTTSGVEDQVSPNSSVLTIAGSSGQNISIGGGRPVAVSFSAADGSGIGLSVISLNRAGSSVANILSAPSISRGSDATQANPFPVSELLTLPQFISRPQLFEVAATIFDIDSNTRLVTTTIVGLPPHCVNGVRDADETEIDAGGSCLSEAGSCVDNWQCVSGACVSGQCTRSPIILSVSPWSGATDDFVTISGRNFGQAPGRVEFGFDRNNSGALESTEWVLATPASCGSPTDSWSDTAVLVTVPDDTALPVGSRAAIRLSRADNPSENDTTVNDRGPRGGQDASGLFTKTNEPRPRLCRVETVSGATESVSTLPVSLRGENFGLVEGRVNFGPAQAAVSSWGETLIASRIPDRLAPGLVQVSVTAGSRESNAVPFTILSESSALRRPVISIIDPSETTPGSLLTVGGADFGDRYGLLALQPNGADCSENIGSCTILNSILPADCGNTWRSSEIIAEIPTSTAAGDYLVFVRTASGLTSLSTSTLRVVVGATRPGLCSVSPSRGPAPLPLGNLLTLNGVGLASVSAVYFYTAGESYTDVSRWLSLSSAGLGQVSARRIFTRIPYDEANGRTMTTGPIRVRVGQNLSNSVTYLVEDCRVAENVPEGLQCCQNGSYSSIDVACPGETVSSGYVWRFTNGSLPRIPSVIEECAPGSARLPSPSPSRQWSLREGACTNAEIRARFTLPMDEQLLRQNTRIYTCGEGDEPNCERSRVDITASFDILYESASLRAIPRGGARLTPNTWYRVELLTGNRSSEEIVVLGQSRISSEPLRVTRPCGQGTAYCFDFVVSNVSCELTAVGMHPDVHTTNDLGRVPDPSRRAQNPAIDPLNIPNPLYYYLFGVPNRSCMVIGADGYGWQWGGAVPTLALAEVSPLPPRYTDSRGTAIAFDSAPLGAALTAGTSTPSRTLVGTSTLVIDLGNPRVVDFWPNCTESCTNASIGLRFNRPMMTDTFDFGVNLYRCDDPLCLNVNRFAPIPVMPIDASPRVYSFVSRQPLSENNWYLVEATPSVLAQTALGSSVRGPSLEPFSFRFRTKAGGGICAVNTVRVMPDPFIAKQIGENTLFRAYPRSSPSQCSALGQDLNPWAYGYSWRVVDPQVADLPVRFTSVNFPLASCSGNCLPRGSVVDRDLYLQSPIGLCGNGVLDQGEDCDVANPGETLGISCNLRCLRPGNTTVGSGSGQCGNGVIDPQNGETCDRGAQNGTACTSDCRMVGSSPVLIQGQPMCGDGAVTTLIEACDPARPQTNPNTCTPSCLNSGTMLSSTYCRENQNFLLNGVRLRNFPECNPGGSVCGDGRLDFGEECEVVGQTIGRVVGTLRVRNFSSANRFSLNEVREYQVSDVSKCSNRCLLTGNLCDESNLPGSVRCQSGTPGCTEQCRFAGSSLNHNTPSLCGDAVVGIGEAPLCEYLPSERPATSIGEDPFQVVRAIGAGPVGDAIQETEVEATVVRDIYNNSIGNISGQADYTLQCGFVEEAVSGLANACPQNVNGRNDYGVDANSCCRPRSILSGSYPEDGAGIVGAGPALESQNICLNTLVSATFDRELELEDLDRKIVLAKGVTATTDVCPGNEITGLVNQTLALEFSTPSDFSPGFWGVVRRFFGRLFGVEAEASEYRPPNIARWCLDQGVIGVPTGRIVQTATGNTTVIDVPLLRPFDKDTVYAVVFLGGEEGLKDNYGVSIRPADANPLTAEADSFVFQTGDSLCTLESVSVTPAQALFTAPNTTTEFSFDTRALQGRRIAPIPGVYDWEYSFGPANHPVFAIPAPTTIATDNTISVASRAVEGTGNLLVNARITADQRLTEEQVADLPVISASANLRALFCANPWPSLQTLPYEDGSPRGRALNDDGYSGGFDGSPLVYLVVNNDFLYFNFSFFYCADAGDPLTRTDDLPFLRPVVVGETAGASTVAPLSDALRRTLFFNDKNSDVIGLQIFSNDFESRNTTNLRLPTVSVVPSGGVPDESSDLLITSPNPVTDDKMVLGGQYLVRWQGGRREGFISLSMIGIDSSNNFIPNTTFSLLSNEPNDGVAVITIPSDIPIGNYQFYLSCSIFQNGGSDCGYSYNPQGSVNFYEIVEPETENVEVVTNRPRSLAEWYRARFGTPAASFRNLTVDGFEAYGNENNLYVRPLNMQTDDPNTLNSYIFNLGINENAAPTTRQVYRRLIDSLNFMINVEDVGYCSTGDGTRANDFYSIDPSETPCVSDLDCVSLGQGRICANASTKLKRDLTRLGQVSTLQNALSSYFSRNNTYPLLTTGVYIPGYTNSRSPSWNSALSTALGVSAGLDPVNDWTGCELEGFDQQTCWNERQSEFFCPVAASIFEYEAVNEGSEYNLHIPFEYLPINSPYARASGISADLISADRLCVAGQRKRPLVGSCGNGIVEAGEQCDGVATVQPQECNNSTGVQIPFCSNECTNVYGSCQPLSVCGNGIVEVRVGEVCDDGSQNGAYGRCAANCQSVSAQYCGNGIRDFIDRNGDQRVDQGEPYLEVCDVRGLSYNTPSTIQGGTALGYCAKASCDNSSLTPVANSNWQTYPGLTTGQNIEVNHVERRGDLIVVVANTAPLPSGRIYISRDGGNSWVQSYTFAGASANGLLSDIKIVSPNIIYAFGSQGNSAIMLISNDAGASWRVERALNTELAGFIRAAFFQPDNGLVIDQRGRLHRVVMGSSGTPSFTELSLPATASILTDVEMLDATTLLVSDTGGRIFRSVDFGRNFAEVLGGNTQNRSRINDIFFVNRFVGYAVGNNRGFWRTIDGGQTFVALRPDFQIDDNNILNLQKVTALDPYNLAIVAINFTPTDLPRSLHLSQNGGETLSRKNSSSLPPVVSNFIFVSEDEALVFGQNSIAGLEDNPYCRVQTSCANDSQCQNNDSCVLNSLPAYHALPGQSCANSCQAAGGWCGDGIVNSAFEQCDSGSALGSETCNMFCRRIVRPPLLGGGQAGGQRCGDGIVEGAEQCDNGSENGVSCNPLYNERCTYCSNACQILTADPSASCGNGLIDQGSGEVCDVLSDGRVINASGATMSCTAGNSQASARGEYSCVNNCRQLVSTCTACGLIETCTANICNQPQNSRPLICRDNIDNDGDGFVDCGVGGSQINSISLLPDTTAGGASPRLVILNPLSSSPSLDWYRSFRLDTVVFGESQPSQLLVLADGNVEDNIGSRGLVSRVGGERFHGQLAVNPYEPRPFLAGGASRSVSVPNLQQNLNTNNACTVAYSLDVNSRFALSRFGVSAPTGLQSANSRAGGDLFSYPVGGENGVISREIVLSPAVPEGVFRVVLRMDGSSAQQNLHLNLFSNSFISTASNLSRIISTSQSATVVQVCNNFALMESSVINRGFTGDFWWPVVNNINNNINCTPVQNSATSTGQAGNVFVHPRVGSGDTHLQAMTIDTNPFANLQNTPPQSIAVYVSDLNRDMYNNLNRRIFVDVYAARPEQSGELSYFGPVQTFEIGNARGTSSNPNARYWHVFNLSYDRGSSGYVIVPQGQNGRGALRTDTSDIIENL